MSDGRVTSYGVDRNVVEVDDGMSVAVSGDVGSGGGWRDDGMANGGVYNRRIGCGVMFRKGISYDTWGGRDLSNSDEGGVDISRVGKVSDFPNNVFNGHRKTSNIGVVISSRIDNNDNLLNIVKDLDGQSNVAMGKLVNDVDYNKKTNNSKVEIKRSVDEEPVEISNVNSKMNQQYANTCYLDKKVYHFKGIRDNIKKNSNTERNFKTDRNIDVDRHASILADSKEINDQNNESNINVSLFDAIREKDNSRVSKNADLKENCRKATNTQNNKNLNINTNDKFIKINIIIDRNNNSNKVETEIKQTVHKQDMGDNIKSSRNINNNVLKIRNERFEKIHKFMQETYKNWVPESKDSNFVTNVPTKVEGFVFDNNDTNTIRNLNCQNDNELTHIDNIENLNTALSKDDEQNMLSKGKDNSAEVNIEEEFRFKSKEDLKLDNSGIVNDAHGGSLEVQIDRKDKSIFEHKKAEKDKNVDISINNDNCKDNDGHQKVLTVNNIPRTSNKNINSNQMYTKVKKDDYKNVRVDYLISRFKSIKIGNDINLSDDDDIDTAVHSNNSDRYEYNNRKIGFNTNVHKILLYDAKAKSSEMRNPRLFLNKQKITKESWNISGIDEKFKEYKVNVSNDSQNDISVSPRSRFLMKKMEQLRKLKDLT